MAAIVPVSTRRLAELAGVSHMTVARVLRNDARVSPVTAAKVRALVKRHGYRPHPMVTALMTQLQATRRTSFRPTVAYLNTWWPPAAWQRCPTKTSQFNGAKARAEELGYKLEMFWLFAPGVTSDRMVQILRTRRIQGVLIGPIQHAWKKFSFAWDQFSLATISFSLREPELANAGSAIFHGTSRVMAELRARGYRRIGYVTSRDFERRVATLAGGAFRLHQHEFRAEDRLEPLIFEDQPDAATLKEWLEKARPDAVLTRLQDVFEQLTAMGVRMPRDLGFAQIDLSPALKAKGVAGMDQLHHLVGAAGIESVINQINNNVRGIPQVPTTLFVYGQFIDGRTLRPPCRSNRDETMTR
jgi:LacI family transcriptional regulator